MKPLLEIHNLCVTFHQDGHKIKALKGVSLNINKGEAVALVGESGSGKSITALSVLGLVSGQPKSTGSVLFKERELMGKNDSYLQKLRGSAVGFIFQEPMTSLNPLHTIERQVGEMFKLHQNLKANALREHVIESLEAVNLDNIEKHLFAYPHQLSGGQRQRVMIAMALANNPDLLIADEPTTALDVTTQAGILSMISDLCAQKKMSLLFVTHDLKIVQKMADRIYIMNEGAIVEEGKTVDIFSHPKKPYTKALINAKPQKTPQKISLSVHEILSVKNLEVKLPIKRGFLQRVIGYVNPVHKISFSLHAGETLGIVGESGSGKTTLAMAVLRLISSQGTITLNGQAIHNIPARALRPLRSNMQIVFQDPYGSLSPRMNIHEIVSEGLKIYNPKDSRTREEITIKALEDVGLDGSVLTRYPHEFSGGQRQRIAIARALVLNPALLILDEPTSALDRTVQARVVDLLHELQKKYQMAYIFISHDLEIIRAVSHKIIVMKDGKVIESGATSDIFNSPEKPYTQALLKASQI